MINRLLSALRRFGASACIVVAAMAGMAGEAQALSCPGSKVEQGGLCYDPPRAGYSCIGSACMEDCRDAYSPSLPGFCHFRGTLTYTEKAFGKRHKSTPHKCLAFYYANCRTGYRMDACGICTYKGAWDTTRHTYFREPGFSPDFSQAFNLISSTMQDTYASSMNDIRDGYNAARDAVQASIDDVLLRLFKAAAKRTLGSGLGATMADISATFNAVKDNPESLNEMKRILSIVSSNAALSGENLEDVATTMLRLSGQYGLLCTPNLIAKFSGTESKLPSALENSSVGIFTELGSAVGVGAGESIGLIHNCSLDKDGVMQFAVVHNVGSSVGYQLGASGDVGLMWNPGNVDKQGGHLIGLSGAGHLGAGLEGGLNWSISRGMRGAQNAIPGINFAGGVGVGIELALGYGHTTILQTFSYKP